MEKLSVLFFIKRTKKLQNGECPIYCRFTLKGKRCEFTLNKSVAEKIWIAAAGKAKGNSVHAYRLNRSLEKVKEDINEIMRQFELQNISPTSVQVKNELLGINKQHKFVVEAYEEHNEKMAALVGTQYAPKTLARHKTSLKHVKDFIRVVYKEGDIELSKVNYQFLIDYEFWLKTNTTCQHNAVIKYITNLGKILREARKKGWMEHDPFKLTNFKYKEVDKPFLSQAELDKLLSKRFSIPRLEKIRDVFVFCCFTGLAFIDVKELKQEDFRTDVDGFCLHQEKTPKNKELE